LSLADLGDSPGGAGFSLWVPSGEGFSPASQLCRVVFIRG